jgi:hypothetical protein
MSETKTRNFYTAEFMYGIQIADDIVKGYIQFFHCVKP